MNLCLFLPLREARFRCVPGDFWRGEKWLQAAPRRFFRAKISPWDATGGVFSPTASYDGKTTKNLVFDLFQPSLSQPVAARRRPVSLLCISLLPLAGGFPALSLSASSRGWAPPVLLLILFFYACRAGCRGRARWCSSAPRRRRGPRRWRSRRPGWPGGRRTSCCPR
jgi:hypothetical protein